MIIVPSKYEERIKGEAVEQHDKLFMVNNQRKQNMKSNNNNNNTIAPFDCKEVITDKKYQ